MIRAAVERPLSTLIAALSVTVIGGFSLLRLPVSLLPELERPRLEIEARSVLSRQEMLDQVTEPLERRLLSVPGVVSVASETEDGLARLEVESEWQTDSDRLRIDVERRLEAVAGVGLQSLEVTLVPGDRSPVVEVAVFGGESGAARTRFARSVLFPELARLEGAGELQLAGERPLHAVVYPSASALAARGLTASELVARLETVGRAVPAGRMRDGGILRSLVVRERALRLEELGRLRIETERGVTLLGDVAQIELEEHHDGSWFRIDGRDGVLVRVYRAPGANAVRLARGARERVAELAPQAPGGLSLEVVSDSSREVVRALRGLAAAALAGLVLGTLVLRLLLGSWRPTAALTLLIPASIVTAFGAFDLWSVSVDVVSLAGLALAAGMLVDSAIVVLEAIEVSRERGEESPEVAGTIQIAGAVAASFATTAVVFLPLIYLRGLARAFFGVQAFAIVSSLAVALVLSLTVTPVFARGGSVGGRAAGRERFLRRLESALARPGRVVFAALLVSSIAVLAVAALPRELVPRAGGRGLRVPYRLPGDLTPEAADELGRRLEETLLATLGSGPSVTLFHLRQDPEGAARLRRGEAEGRIDLGFESAAEAARVQEQLAQAVARLPDVEAWVEPRASAFVEALQRAGRRVEIVVSAASRTRVDELAERVGETVEQRFGVGSQRDSSRRGAGLALSWRPDRVRWAVGGSAALEDQVRSGLGRFEAGRLEVDGVEPEIRVGPTRPERPELLPVGPLQWQTDDPGRVVPLGAVARLEPERRPPPFERLDHRPAVRLQLELDRGRLPELSRALDALAVGPDETVRLGGEAYEIARSFRQLRLALMLSLVLVFLTVAAVYESLWMPLVVMSTVPVAAGGALGLLWLAGQSLNVLSFLGLILLGGIVVNNAIVLVHRIEQLRRAGSDRERAVRQAAGERYRPILMTTLTTLLGMIPLALIGGEGAELRQGLAIAVIGGLVTSTFASLLLVPVLYRWARRG